VPLIRPRPLGEGDRVAVVAPSGTIDPDRLEAGLAILRGWGLDPVTAPHVPAGHSVLPYLAADDARRAQDFQDAWTDPGIAAVIRARGGYGAQRVVALLDWDALAAAPPKHFIGCSDATALHESIAQRLGLATLYGPMAAAAVFTKDDATAEHLRHTLFDPGSVAVLSSPTAGPLIRGQASGVTAGGCLTMLATSLGTPAARPSFAGALLCLEDVNEPPYALDRALTQLLRSGALDGVAGIVLGSWRDCGPEPLLRDLFRERLAPLASRSPGNWASATARAALPSPWASTRCWTAPPGRPRCGS
jgi:muramoyltetrapeptide carboxypeptidase